MQLVFENTVHRELIERVSNENSISFHSFKLLNLIRFIDSGVRYLIKKLAKWSPLFGGVNIKQPDLAVWYKVNSWKNWDMIPLPIHSGLKSQMYCKQKWFLWRVKAPFFDIHPKNFLCSHRVLMMQYFIHFYTHCRSSPSNLINIVDDTWPSYHQ